MVFRFQDFKASRFRGSEGFRVSRLKGSGFQVSKVSKVRDFEVSKIQSFRVSKFLGVIDFFFSVFMFLSLIGIGVSRVPGIKVSKL
jgi:hypothetical protein